MVRDWFLTSGTPIPIPYMLLTPTLGNRSNSRPLGPRRLRPTDPATLKIRQRDHVISSERILPTPSTSLRLTLSTDQAYQKLALRNT